MDTFKDIWKELDKRLTSPLFGSFLISWLLYNYKIPVALLFIKQDELGPGYYSYFDLIEKQATLLSFTIPAIIALIYTFAYPHLKEFITLYLSEKDIHVNEAVYKQSKVRTVPIMSYLEKVNILKEQEIQLANHISDAGVVQTKYDALLLTEKHLSAEIISLTDKYANDSKNLAITHSNEIENIKETFNNTISGMRNELSQKSDMYHLDRTSLQNRVMEQDREIFKLESERMILKNELALAVTGNEEQSKIDNIHFSKRLNDTIIIHKTELEDQEQRFRNKLKELSDDFFDLAGRVNKNDISYEEIKNEITNRIHEATEYSREGLAHAEEVNGAFESLSQQYSSLESQLADSHFEMQQKISQLEYRTMKDSKVIKTLFELEPMLSQKSYDLENVLSTFDRARHQFDE